VTEAAATVAACCPDLALLAHVVLGLLARRCRRMCGVTG
jgi:hypothetical protein